MQLAITVFVFFNIYKLKAKVKARKIFSHNGGQEKI